MDGSASGGGSNAIVCCASGDGGEELVTALAFAAPVLAVMV